MSTLVGADPELFIANKGVAISAHNLLPGSKTRPFYVEGGSIQVDGMAAEFNVNPTDDEQEFVNTTQLLIEDIQNRLSGKGRAVVRPTVRFRKEVFDKVPIFAKRLGCDPDYNAYTLSLNPPPRADGRVRSAGGHVHIGWTSDADCTCEHHMMRCAQVVKNLDHLLGVPSVILDTGVERRKTYGQAGSFRPKKYGVEYRTLSNFWLSSKERMSWVFRCCKQSINMEDVDFQRMDIINEGKGSEALEYVSINSLDMPDE